MPIEVRSVQNGMGRIWTCHGVLTGKELIANNDYIFESKRYDGVRWVLIDYTDTTLEVSAQEVRTIKYQDDRLATVLPELVTAVIVPTDYAYGMSRMWEMLTERPGWSVRSFRSRPEGEAWLRQEGKRKFGIELPPDLNAAD
jgi:hypothetical protein